MIMQLEKDLSDLVDRILLERMARHLVDMLRTHALQSVRDMVQRLRLGSEALRLRAMLDRATPPDAMQAAPVAPARGPMRLVENVSIDADLTLRRDGWRWEGLDQLSVMCRQAWLAHQAQGGGAGFVPPFSPGQIAMGRHYAGLVERHDGAGIKCASLDGRSSGGSGGGFADAYLAEGREIAAIRRRIGDGVAMAVRRMRPSERGSRATITDRRVVDLVCLGGMDLTAVLRAHGWAQKGETRKALRLALCAALDRMQGYGGRAKKGIDA